MPCIHIFKANNPNVSNFSLKSIDEKYLRHFYPLYICIDYFPIAEAKKYQCPSLEVTSIFQNQQLFGSVNSQCSKIHNTSKILAVSEIKWCSLLFPLKKQHWYNTCLLFPLKNNTSTTLQQVLGSQLFFDEQENQQVAKNASIMLIQLATIQSNLFRGQLVIIYLPTRQIRH